MIAKNLRQKLAEAEPSAERHDLQVEDAATGSAVNLALVQRDAFSCLAWEMRIRRTPPANVNVRQWAEQVCSRVTSLLQPLQLLEVDSLRNQALLRSIVGPNRQDGTTYFEVMLDGTASAVVRRYQVIAGEAEMPAGREQIAFALTHEGLLKLVSDLLAA